MEPRPEGRGEADSRAHIRVVVLGASMEPRPEGRGESCLRSIACCRNVPLQWSHVPKDVERLLTGERLVRG